MTNPKQSVRHIRISDLVPHPSNIRDDDEDNLSELAASIYEHGIIQPLAVTEHPTEPEKWLVLAGHRRRLAAREAGLDHVPCVIRHDLDADVAEQLVVMLVENCQRRDLGPVEKAEAFEQLRVRGLSTSAIARRTGLAQPTISYYLSLLELDSRTLEQVRAGVIPVTQAIGAVREVRRTTRRRDRRPQPGQPVVLEPAHFTRKHSLAKLAAERCDHSTRPKVGAVACGQCWEAAIRADAEESPGLRSVS